MRTTGYAAALDIRPLLFLAGALALFTITPAAAADPDGPDTSAAKVAEPLVATATAEAAPALPTPPGSDLLEEYPFRPGERLTYEITVLGAPAGKGTLSVGKPRTWQGHDVLPLHGTMTSTGFWDNVYPVRNRMLSLVPRTGAYPLHTEMSLDQNGANRVMKLDFHPDKATLDGVRNENNKGDKAVKGKAPAFTQDALSWFYHLRARRLIPGSGFSFKGYSGKFIYTVYCTVGQLEEVWTPVGMLPAYRVDANIRRDGDKNFKREVTFWLGTDSNKLPIKMSFDFTVGRVEGLLVAAVLPP